MANGNTTPSGIGQINAAGDRKALFLRVFSGEVLTTFTNETHMMDKHLVRTISSGKSAQFPVTGTAAAKYHTPGQSIADADNSYLNTFKHNEKIIGIDGLCLSSVFVSNIEEAMSHYDVRSTYAMECGRALANHFDKSVTNTVIAAARSAENISGLNGSGGLLLRGGQKFLGDGVTSADAAALLSFARQAAEVFDRKDVPSADRYIMLRPKDYYALVNQGLTAANNLISRDYNDANGSVAKGVVYEAFGFKLVKSNHLPSTNLTSDALLASNQIATENDVFGTPNGTPVGYGADFSTTAALAFHKGAVGTVKLLDLATESEYQIDRQGTLMVCKYAMGHGVLRPECAIELRTGAGTDAGV